MNIKTIFASAVCAIAFFPLFAGDGPGGSYAAERQVFLKAIADRKNGKEALSNAFERLCASSGMTADDKARSMAELAKGYKNRRIYQEAADICEDASAMEGISPDARIAALDMAGQIYSEMGFSGPFATYDDSMFHKAAGAYGRILSMKEATGKQILGATKGRADALLNARQDVDDEAQALYEAAPDLPGLSAEERGEAMYNLARFYLRSLQREKAFAAFAETAKDASAKKNTRKEAARHALSLALLLEGGEKTHELVKRGFLKEFYEDVRDYYAYCHEAGRRDEYVDILKKRLADASIGANDKRGDISLFMERYIHSDANLFMEDFGKVVLPALKENAELWWPGLFNVFTHGRYANSEVRRSPGIDAWVLALSEQVPEGRKGLDDGQAFGLALKIRDGERCREYAKKVLGDDSIKEDVRRKAFQALSVLEKGASAKGAVRQCEKWFEGRESATSADKADFISELCRMALRFGLDALAMDIADEYAKRLEPAKNAVIECLYVENAPQDVRGILDSEFYRKGAKGLLDRKYGDNLQFLMETDATFTSRKVTAGEKGVPYPELFVFCDRNGVKILVRVFLPKEEIGKYKAGFQGGPGYEAYIAKGVDDPYDCLLFSPPDINPGMDFCTQYDNDTGYRRLDPKKNFALSHLTLDDSVATLIDVSWEYAFSEIPENGTAWYFEPIVWTQGGLSWGGSASVHNRSSFGKIVFGNMTEANRTAIKRQLLPKAAAVYRKAKSPMNGQIEIWKDDQLGDRAFYKTRLEGFVENIDPYIARIKPDMSDEDADEIFDAVAKTCFNIEYEVWHKRREYLEESLLPAF